MSAERDPGATALLRSVVGALNAGQPERAYEICSAALSGKSRDPVLNELAALAAHRSGRQIEAKTLARASLEVRPDHAATLTVLGRACRALGEDVQAMAAFRQASACAPENAEPAFLLCAMLLRRGDPEARPLFDVLSSRFPDAAKGWAEIGQVLLDLGKREAALICLAHAERTAPCFALALRRGLILKDLGRPRDAARAFDQAIAFDAGSPRAWLLLGLSRQDCGEVEAAATAYRTALATDPGMAEAAVNLGTLLQEAGDLEGAQAAYGQALRTRPDTFGRIAQAMTTSPKGELWLDLGTLRRKLVDTRPLDAK